MNAVVGSGMNKNQDPGSATLTGTMPDYRTDTILWIKLLPFSVDYGNSQEGKNKPYLFLFIKYRYRMVSIHLTQYMTSLSCILA
jgi:hypothetical protein